MTPELRLNLGAGKVRLPGYRSVDLYERGADERVDLSVFPWPWESGSVKAVAMFHYLEHAHDPERTIGEVHRILEDGGEFWVKVPHYRAIYGIVMQHRSLWSWAKVAQLGWTEGSWVTSGELFERRWQRFNFTVKATRYHMPWGVVRVLNWAANVNPWAWEWLGMPCDEMEWRGVKANISGQPRLAKKETHE